MQGCVDGFEQMGVFDRLEYGDPPASFGLFGGYFYNSLTQSRLFGVRSGAGWEAVDRTFFDTASQDDPAVRRSRLAPSTVQDREGHGVDGRGSSPPTASRRPSSRSGGQGRPRQPPRPRRRRPTSNCSPGRSASSATCACSSRRSCGHRWAARSRPGILPALLGEIEPDAIAKLMTGIGDVDSAGIATQIFDMSRIVRDSAELDAAFDGDLDGLLDRLAKSGSPDAQRLLAAVDDFMYDHGGRGPNEWDIYQPATRRTRRCCCRRSSATRQRRRRRRPRTLAAPEASPSDGG